MHRISFDKAADGTSFAKVAFTVDDWELFDSADQSMVDELNGALEGALSRPGASLSSVLKIMDPLLQKFEDHGANDGEGEFLVRDAFQAWQAYLASN